MKLEMIDVGAQKFGDFRVSYSNRPWYTFQLFRTATVFEIDGETIVSPPNSIVLFNKESRQNFRSAGDIMINDYVLFIPEEIDMSGLVFNRPLPVSNPEFFHRILVMIYEEMYSANPLKKQTCERLMLVLLSKTEELCSLYAGTGKGFTEQNDLFTKLRNEVLTAPQKKWTIIGMAKRCNLSSSRFQYIYKKLFRISPIAEVISARMVKSKALLRNEHLTIHEIADRCGYSGETFFVRQFKAQVGMTPTEYRKTIIKKTTEQQTQPI